MEIYKLMMGLTDALLSGKPVCILENGEHREWILIKSIKILSSGIIRIETNDDECWYTDDNRFSFKVLDELYTLKE